MPSPVAYLALLKAETLDALIQFLSVFLRSGSISFVRTQEIRRQSVVRIVIAFQEARVRLREVIEKLLLISALILSPLSEQSDNFFMNSRRRLVRKNDQKVTKFFKVWYCSTVDTAQFHVVFAQ